MYLLGVVVKRVKDNDQTIQGNQQEKDFEITRLKELLNEKQKEVDKFRERYSTVPLILGNNNDNSPLKFL